MPVLIAPVLVVFGFAFAQWWQARSWGADPVSWWHLAGVAAAALTWLLWPDVALAEVGRLEADGRVAGYHRGQWPR